MSFKAFSAAQSDSVNDNTAAKAKDLPAGEASPRKPDKTSAEVEKPPKP